jgi:hypothetical protein
VTIQSDVAASCFAAAKQCNYPLSSLGAAQEIHIDAITPCREVFEGKVPPGGECDISAECAGEAHCAASPSSTCRGTCVARVGSGSPCVLDDDCKSPSANTWPVCHEKTCADVSVNSPAAYAGNCGQVSPNQITPCADGLWCPGAALGLVLPDLCSRPLASGAACDGSDPYRRVCQDGLCDSTNHCTSYAVRRSAGDPCDETHICDGYAGLRCANGACTTAPFAPGYSCELLPWFESSSCSPPMLAAGKPCNTSAECASGICDVTCKSALCSAR